MDSELTEIASKCICLTCIGDDLLQKIVAKGVIGVECAYCRHIGPCISMSELAEAVDQYLRKYLVIGGDVPAGYNDHDNMEYKQEGDSLEWLLQEELGIDYDPAKDLVQVLVENDPAWPPDGEEPFYQIDQNYVRADIASSEYHQSWKDFVEAIKHRGRFFDESVRGQLAAILGEPGSPKAEELPEIDVGPMEKVNCLFRSRLADSDEEAVEMLRMPKKHLGPPSPEQAIAGRMNPSGISVFYGAVSKDTAIAEVRPSVGSLVVVGEFKFLRKFRLLNLPMIDIYFTRSIFHLDYENRVARSHFFKIFHGLIARPIRPRAELLEYIPTQAVAEYVARVLGFDGILYGSAQIGAVLDKYEDGDDARSRVRIPSEKEMDDIIARCNIVLFDGFDSLELQEKNITVEAVRAVQYKSNRRFELEGIGEAEAEMF